MSRQLPKSKELLILESWLVIILIKDKGKQIIFVNNKIACFKVKLRWTRGSFFVGKWKPWSKLHFKSFEAFLANVVFLHLPPPSPSSCQRGGVLFDYSVNPVLPFEILNSQRVGIPSFHL